MSTTLTEAHAKDIIKEYNKWMNRQGYTEEILVAQASLRSYWLCYGSGKNVRATPYLVVRTNNSDIYTLLNFINFAEICEIHGAKRLVMGDNESCIAFEIKG